MIIDEAIQKDLTRKFLIFNNMKEVKIRTDLIKEYENKIGSFTNETIEYLITTLNLDKSLTVEELAKEIETAMREDINDSALVKDILSDKSNHEELFNA